MRISDWSSDVCSSDLVSPAPRPNDVFPLGLKDQVAIVTGATSGLGRACAVAFGRAQAAVIVNHLPGDDGTAAEVVRRSEEHTSELQSLMRISYAVFCLKKKKQQTTIR